MDVFLDLPKELRDFIILVLRFAINFFILLLMIKFNYSNTNSGSKYKPTFYLLNTTVFFLCYMFSNAKLSVGFAFGLFAVFSIIKYRTVQLAIKEMTFMFVILGLALINSLSSKKLGIAEIAFADIVILVSSYFIMNKHNDEHIQSCKYDFPFNPENTKIDNQSIKDEVAKATGLNIIKIKIEKISINNNKLEITIYYKLLL